MLSAKMRTRLGLPASAPGSQAARPRDPRTARPWRRSTRSRRFRGRERQLSRGRMSISSAGSSPYWTARPAARSRALPASARVISLSAFNVVTPQRRASIATTRAARSSSGSSSDSFSGVGAVSGVEAGSEGAESDLLNVRFSPPEPGSPTRWVMDHSARRAA